MQWVDRRVGQDCWCFVGNHKGKMSKGKVVAVVDLPGYAPSAHYIVELPTSIDPLLEVRDGFTISDAAKKPIGMYRRGNGLQG